MEVGTHLEKIGDGVHAIFEDDVGHMAVSDAAVDHARDADALESNGKELEMWLLVPWFV